MAKKKRANIAKTVLTRRAKQAAQNEAAGSAPSMELSEDTSRSIDSEDSQPGKPSETENDIQCSSQSSSEQSKQNLVHKKFGKFRILHDENFVKTLDMNGDSDSETSSCLEVKVVDPCASSESDGGTPLNTGHTDNRIPVSSSPQPNDNDTQRSEIIENELNNTNEKECISISSEDSNSEIIKTFPTIVENEISEIPLPDYLHIPMPQEPDFKQVEEVEEHQELLHEDDDEEVITIVQILEDNEDTYYDIQMASPPSQKDEICISDSKKIENESLQSEEKVDTGVKIDLNLEKLKLSEKPINSPPTCFDENSIERQLSKMECDVSAITTPEQPDGSATPCSTMSEDSIQSKPVTESSNANSNDSFDSPSGIVRRSSRIKTISSQKQKRKGQGIVKKGNLSRSKSDEFSNDQMNDKDLNIPSMNSNPDSPTFPVPVDMPVKVKSRWRRCSELEMNTHSPIVSPLASPNINTKSSSEKVEKPEVSSKLANQIIEERLKQFIHLEENFYVCERTISKETKRMICDCFLTKEETERGDMGCGEDCLNRLLMIECNYRCPVGDRCTNRKFQKRENAPLRVFYADKKGCGLEAAENIRAGEFLMEYVGEVLNSEQFYERANKYSTDNNLHHYFMALKGEEVIDATLQGNISRFINHSCEPNAETQKWTVNGELRIGFFSKREIPVGEEITFDYQFKRFGKEAQRCYCGANNCRGWIGGEPDSEDEEEEEEEEDEDVTTSKSKKDREIKTEDGKIITKPATKKVRDKQSIKPKKYRPKADISLDADIEDDLDALSRTGIKNQHHTLTLSRTMVRAKTRTSQTSLLRLLREADLPCRRLFLDYRGLRLLAPWCSSNVTDQFRLEMLQTLERLPIPNKSMVAESKLFNVIEKWRSQDSTSSLTLIDEATGLPVEVPGKTSDESSSEKDSVTKNKIVELCKQLHERWSSLKEVYKIPKKERIQQMKEHEREANIERRAADSSGTRDRNDRERERDKERDRDRDRERDRDRDKYRERRDRERDRDRDRERDKRRRGSSPDARRAGRLDDRAIMAPLSKEERRRAFAEAAAAAERARSTQQFPPTWPTDFPPNMFPPGMMPNPNMMGGPNMPMPGMLPPGMMPPPGMIPSGPGMMPNGPGMMPNGPGMMPSGPGMVPNGPGMIGGMEWMAPDCSGFYPPPQAFCMPPNFMGPFPPGFMFPPSAFPPTPTAPPPVDPAPPQPLEPQEPKKIRYSDGKKLPSMWRSAQDEKGRTYFYHVKLRLPQWLPPAFAEGESTPSEDEFEEEDPLTETDVQIIKGRQPKLVEGVDGVFKVIKEKLPNGVVQTSTTRVKKVRPGLVTEVTISPRTEEDKIASKLEMKRYKETKEKLKKRKERALAAKLHAAKKAKLKVKQSSKPRQSSKLQQAIEDVLLTSSEDEIEETTAMVVTVENQIDEEERIRRVKETFRSSMAKVMVHVLNHYRKPDAPVAKITNTEDFKHLARKLTHFVMLKELKHCRSVDELSCNDSVKQKAREFVRKYMAKFGPVYQRPADEQD